MEGENKMLLISYKKWSNKNEVKKLKYNNKTKSSVSLLPWDNFATMGNAHCMYQPLK